MFALPGPQFQQCSAPRQAHNLFTILDPPQSSMTAEHRSSTGRVVFVGAGPGAPDLLTVRGLEATRAADVIVHDALVPSQVLEAIGGRAERIPVNRSERGDEDPGAATGQLLVRLAASGRTVVRLKGGDPAVFARLAEELEPLRAAGVPVEIVPGVTAALAAAAAAGVPLTSRASASSLTIVTGHEADDKLAGLDFESLATIPGTLALYMGVEQVGRWSRALLAAGTPGDTPVTIVSRCSWPDQRIATTTLAACASDFSVHGWQPPSVAIVGTAVRAATAGPLSGRRVLITRPAGQADELAALVRGAGGECLHVPVIRVDPPDSWAPLDDAIRAAGSYDWIVFASSNGVRSFVERLRALRLDGRVLGTSRLAAIGPATRSCLEQSGLVCDLTPDEFRSEGLVAAFQSLPPARFLLVRAAAGRDLLRRELEVLGHEVTEVVAYVTRPAEPSNADIAGLAPTSVDWITVTSSSIAAAAAQLFGDRLRTWRIASISPITTSALQRCGVQATVEAAEASSSGLVGAMAAWEAARTANLSQPADSLQPAR
ncbi:MAG: uroporphyrinogen-III C-methyltransferase [Actinomycetota bacterium]